MKRRVRSRVDLRVNAFSAALCRGLIEARRPRTLQTSSGQRFPRLYAAASLKPQGPCLVVRLQRRFSAALCRGLIEASVKVSTSRRRSPFSAALCRGLIEATPSTCGAPPHGNRFPRLYAAASLKRHRFASTTRVSRTRFPRLYAAASLKPPVAGTGHNRPQRVFRGFMPRPH